MATDFNAISGYTYNYNNQLRPKIDKNDSATWDKDELKNYADAYKKATGTTLDVDKLMEKYANEDGVIDTKAQEKMLSDDALGLSKLTNASSTSSTSSTTGSTTTTSNTGSSTNSATMSLDKKVAVYDAVTAFSYEYGGKLQPLLDKNSDGMWDKSELTNYSNAYYKATGNRLDVDALVKKYGNEEGYIDPQNQQKMKDDDALGLSSLKSAYDSARSTPTAVVGNKVSTEPSYGTRTRSAVDGGFSMEDILSSMSPSNKMFYSVGINRLDSMGSMLNAFNSASGINNNMFSSILSDMSSLNQYKTSAAYSAMSGNAMNFTL